MHADKSIYLKALRRFLSPVCRFALRHTIRIQEVVEILKQSMVETAVVELNRGDVPVNVTRLALMTGLHRKDANRILNRGHSEPSDDSLLTRVIGQWLNSKKFQTLHGKPKILSFGGAKSEFDQLVHSVSRELVPASILAEMERIGAVRRTDDGLKLITSMYQATGDIKEALSLLASDVNELFEAVQENAVNASPTPNLHIKTEFDAIPDAHVAEIREWLLKEGSAFHERAQSYLSKFDKDINPKIKGKAGSNKVSLVGFSRVDGAPKP